MRIKKLIGLLLAVVLVLGLASSSFALSNAYSWSLAFDLQRTSAYEEMQTKVLQRVIYEYFRYYDMSSTFVDGIYGSNTKNKVITFQSYENITADGIVGFNTWGALQDKVALGNDVYSSKYGTLDGYYVSRARSPLAGGGFSAEYNLGFTDATYFAYKTGGHWYTRLRTNVDVSPVN